MSLGKHYAFYLHDEEDLMLQALFQALKVEGRKPSEKLRNLIRTMYKQLSLYLYTG